MERFDASWRARSAVRHGTIPEVAPMVEAHYIGRPPGVVVCRLVMTVDGQCVGTCIFALPPRETSKRYGGETWELARLWIDDAVPSNSETWLVARSIAHVRKVHQGVVALVSYADPSAGHAGVIYRAGNWAPDGRTDDDRRTPRFDYAVDGRRYSRRSHVPDGVIPDRIPRVSKHRFLYRLSDAPTEVCP